ncbi:MAG: hypothetical protein ACRC7U_09000 [Moraxella sp.]|jgi:hypothetical protein
MSHDKPAAAKRAYLQQQAQDIIAIAKLQTNTALSCLHKINVMGGTTEKAYLAVNTRILEDLDTLGAYHAIAMSQSTADLPFDVPALVTLILTHGEPALQLRLLKLFDKQPVIVEPIPTIKHAILASGDQPVIDMLNAHLLGRQAANKAAATD